jgi:hypothetical protein
MISELLCCVTSQVYGIYAKDPLRSLLFYHGPSYIIVIVRVASHTGSVLRVTTRSALPVTAAQAPVADRHPRPRPRDDAEEPNHVSVDCRHRQLTLGFCMATGPVFRRTTCCCDTEMALFYLFTPRAPRLRAIHVHVPRQCKCVFPSDGQTSLPNRMRLSREQGKNYSQEAS